MTGINKQKLFSFIIISFMINILSINSVHGSINEGQSDYFDITVDQVWELLTDTSNGIQIPIDVRTDSEWISEHIDTPFPEHPRHHNFYDWDDPNVLQTFLSSYNNEEIIVYCRSGGRSVSAINILIDNGFIGTIYNMDGGITAWKAENYPTVPNRPPEKPIITGPQIGQIDTEYSFTVNTTDPDQDNVYYCVDWGDETNEECFGPFDPNDKIILNHSWEEKGLYQIMVKSRDIYTAESQWAYFDFDISATELTINSIQGGFLSLSIEIENIGKNTAENISSEIQVKGGILSGINLTHTCSGCSSCGTTLAPGEIKIESTIESGLLFGFGSIEITISAWADNAEKIMLAEQGRIIGFFTNI